MNQYRFVNEDGLAALNYLSHEKPSLFVDADPHALSEAMERRAETSDLWDTPLDVTEDISSLNRVQVPGPETDSQHARVVRKGLAHLPSSEGLNDHLWATINCFVLPRFVSIRWSHVQPKDSKRLPSFVKSHWLDGGKVSARRNNSVARLWWLGEFSARAAEHTNKHSAEELLDAMAQNVNLYHQLLARPNLLARSRLVAVIYEVFLEPGNDYLGVTRYANEMLTALNLTAAQVSLDFMDMNELRGAVEWAIPPKER